ncbi:MAG: hypothetical protein FD123_782 [Bacteroidetes bacterium]|nr:MAG: hypothetical protein FD123_782 [Bacteroidota bacterium]
MRYSILLILLCSMHNISAQNIIPNASFENNCGTNDDPIGVCPCFTTSCLPGWSVSHGSPHIVFGGSPDQVCHIAMWAAAGSLPDNGEGIFSHLTTSTVDQEYYNLCFWYKTTYTPPADQGTITFQLTNSSTRCGYSCDGYPCVMANQNITPPAAVFPQQNWTYVSWTFKATGAYNFLRIYASSNAPQTNVAGLEIDGLTLYKTSVCSGTLFMNNTVNYNPSIGYYEQYSIVAGSTAITPFSTMMTITPSVSTTFKANTNGYIDLVNSFSAVPDNAHYFETVLGPCGCPGGTGGPERFGLFAEAETILPGEIILSPNPTSGSFTLLRNSRAPAEIEITDLTGRAVRKPETFTGESIIFDISEQPAGIYLIRVHSGTDIKMLKLVKE